ncbi:hypothetical protein BGW41_000966 [Actinomortierella wolfii]|nr:hypothetical protein BGW41_000966 [Actinomortierella wolfii]
MKSILIACVAAIAVASAQKPTKDIHFTEPISTTVWTAGKNHTVSWKYLCDWADPSKLIPINLLVAPDPKLSKQKVPVSGVNPIGFLNCTSGKSASVAIPPTVASGTVYGIMSPTGGENSWSADFTIQGSGPIPSATLLPTSSAVATTATLPATQIQATRTATNAPTPTGAASSVKAGSALALAVVAAIGSLVL